MFSHFECSIYQKIPSQIISIQDLVALIKHNSKIELINQLRELRRNEDVGYKLLKKSLSNITAHCIVKKNKLDTDNEISENFIQFSRFIYIDIDVIPIGESVFSYKEYIIKKYGDIVSLVAVSSSLKGVSILVKVNNEISISNFKNIWKYVADVIFKDEEVDYACNNIGRCLYITHDPDVFVSYTNSITVPEEIFQKKCGSGHITEGGDLNNISSSTTPIKRKQYRYNEIKSVLCFETNINVKNPVVDFREENYIKVYPPLHIKDGTKHKIYRGIINALFYLNPNIHEDYIYSYLIFINNSRAKPKMDKMELQKLFNYQIERLKKTENHFVKTKVKQVHINKDCNLSPKVKKSIADKLIGMNKRLKSQLKINQAIKELQANSLKINYTTIANHLKMDRGTVSKRMKEASIDMEFEVQNINLKYAHYNEMFSN